MIEHINPDDAYHFLREVDPDDILVAARMHYPSGIHDEWISTLEELMWFLQPASDRDIPGVSIEGMASWVQDAIGDITLAKEIRVCKNDHENFVDACEAAYYKTEARVTYLKKQTQRNSK